MSILCWCFPPLCGKLNDMKENRFGKTEYDTARKLPDLLLPWYDANKRILPWRENTDPYRVWISEIMLQQTRVEAAKEHYVRFLRQLPTVQDLADCPEDRLLKLWEGLGYYSRARNLQKAARLVAENGFPSTAQEWRKLPGIGDYTAGAIASIAFGQPEPAVDGNVIRVLSRLFGDGRTQDILKREFALLLKDTYPRTRCGDFTQSLMELGATVCLPLSPLCLTCPLLNLCKTKSDKLPLRKEKAPRRIYEKTLLLFHDKNYIAVCKRREGVLKGTYGFFSVESKLSLKETEKFLHECGFEAFQIGKAATHKHVFSHLEWHMTAYPVFCEELTSYTAKNLSDPAAPHTPFTDLVFASKQDIEKNYSLPSAFRWALSLLADE